MHNSQCRRSTLVSVKHYSRAHIIVVIVGKICFKCSATNNNYTKTEQKHGIHVTQVKLLHLVRTCFAYNWPFLTNLCFSFHNKTLWIVIFDV